MTDDGAPALPADALVFAQAGGLLDGFWVFAYGSLMWNPEIAFDRRIPATIHGFHRRFCVYSHVYRGTPRAPGLLLGLDRGGSCRGLGFHVPAEAARAAWASLWEREMITRVYRPIITGARTAEGILPMVAFVAERASDQYCPEIPDDAAARILARASGTRGPNRDYFDNTLTHLAELGIRDRGLERIKSLIEDNLDTVKIVE